MAAELHALILKYVKTLPAWQKILASVALEIKKPIQPSDPIIEVAQKRFLQDFDLIEDRTLPGDDVINALDSLDVRPASEVQIKPRMLSVSNCKNINALVADSHVTFSPKLTVVYGDNGSGKSGYARLLNSVFHSRGDSKILPNILKPKDQQGVPEAEFEFDISGVKQSIKLPGDQENPIFKHFACFDSKTVSVHLEGTNELYVMPDEMNFFNRLAKLIQIVSEKLSEYKCSNIQQNPLTNKLNGVSSIKTLIEAIDEKTDTFKLREQIGELETISPKLEVAEKAFHEIKALDPSQKLIELNDIQKSLDAFKDTLDDILNSYGELYLSDVRQAIDALINAKEKDKQVGVNSFKTEFLKAVGSDSWKEFIFKMHTLSAEEASALGRQYPRTGDHCPLCLQELSGDALKLFEKYFDFLEGKSSKNLGTAEKKISELHSFVAKLRLPSFKPKLYTWLENNQPESLARINDDLASCKIYFDKVRESLENQDAGLLPETVQNTILGEIGKLLAIVEEERKQYNHDAYHSDLKSKEATYVELQHCKEVACHYHEIEKFVSNLSWLKKIEEAVGKISTHSITAKQKEIFNEHFNKQYKQKFYKEAKLLDVDFHIEVKAKGAYGKTSRKLDVLNYSPSEILSEGQQKVLALADFLTEVDVCNLNGGIVFDDPVNSLDHERKLKIAERLVLESDKRQVVVFTHDIGFLSDLKNISQRHEFVEKEDVYFHWVSNVGDDYGVIELNHKRELEADYKSTARALECLQQAESMQSPSEQEKWCKKGFDCLRKTYEAFILHYLFAGTVVRFDRQIKYGQFKEVYCPEDVISIVSEKLAYCSGFIDGHLGADNYSGQRPSTKLLKQEITAFDQLRSDFKKRKKVSR